MFKKFQIITFLAVCGYMSSVSSSIIEDVDPVLLQQQFLIGLVRRTYINRAGIAQASHDDDCFDYYFQEQDSISKDYNKQYNICKATAQSARDQLTAEGVEKRNEVIKRGNGICGDLDACEAIDDILDFFKCYTDASAANYPILYNISVDTSAEYTNLQVFYQRIDNDEKSCTTLARNNYVNLMAISNANLEKCLNGEPLPTISTSTTEEIQEDTI